MDTQDNTVTVNVKWMSKQYNGLKMCLDEPLETFKVQLWSLTGVPPERQKIMFKGIIPNDADLNKIKITDGSKLMLIGSAENPPECKEKILFFEDLKTHEKAKFMSEHKIMKLPAGIMNLGNTCYFNSVMQFLFPVTELWDTVAKSVEDNNNTSDKTFAKSLLDMKKQLSFTLERFYPLVQVQNLRKINPLFCRKDDKTGLYLQQDAEECLNCILTNLNNLSDEKVSEKLFGFSLLSKTQPVKTESDKNEKVEKTVKPESKESKNKGDTENKDDSVKDEQKEEKNQSEEEGKDKSKESDDKMDVDEDHSSSVERNLLLSCYMGTPLKSVGTLMDGISLSLNEELTKFSEKEGKDVLHNKVSTLNSLPKYLITHLVRFEWKQKSQVSLTDAIKAKVCRRVNFERYLDVTSLCSEELQKKLRLAKNYELKMEKEEDSKAEDQSEKVKLEGYELSPGEYATGKYELVSIVTHQGRTADAGHYICWAKDTRENPDKNLGKKKNNEEEDEEELRKEAKKKKNEDTWIKFDDDVVSEHDWGTFDLCGGRSDYHIAVLLLYKAQNVKL